MCYTSCPAIFAVLFAASCLAQRQNSIGGKPQLIFQSGFEGSSRVVQDSNSDDHGAYMEYITGFDNTYREKSNWDKDWAATVRNGRMQIQYTGGNSAKRYAQVVPEPGNPANHVLKFWLNDSWPASENQEKARIQANIYGIKNGFKEFYQSVRVFLTEDFTLLQNYPGSIRWLTLSEFWNNEWWVAGEKNGFRITLGIGKSVAEKSALHFILEAEITGQKLVWRADPKSSNVAVPVGQWFTMDYYLKEGNAETGRFYLAITPDGGKKQVVYDMHNFTHATTDTSPNGVTGYNPAKLYTSKDVVAFVKAQGKTLQVYWDDFKLWKNKRPETTQ